ncbi:helix-turn-helix transcriptional regulator [Burkholderia pyrrocinia]|uniref:helix-turn-helix transcriptional regulator n=1 Tax=Burkholderia stagnalis TaxID=1503054 RepID=UPI0002F0A520|nr:helix-turn-helix transcriptional regulator [Burkholderia stagnalis]KVN41308.1 helix-turn-helix transcriptional regulator [Burkholderia pyrrocinia]WGS46306.1 helix-turn-helix transcriptional regulator [Burkholderia sp. JSH-S8]
METRWVPQESQATSDEAGLGVAEFSELMARIYQGPMEAPPWAGALELVRRWLGANYVTLILRAAASDRRAPLSVHASEHGPVVPGDGEASYNNYYYSLDPFIGLPADRVVTADEVFGETGWLSSEFYKQFLLPSDVRHILGADLRTPSGVECRFRVCRGHAAKPFSARDKAICGLLLPHLKRAVELHSRLDSAEVERSIYANAVNRMQVGMITLDEKGAVIDMNGVADEILKQGNGLCLARGTIEATDAQENRALQRLIRHAVMGHHGTATAIVEAMPVTRSYDKPRLGLLVRTILLSDWSEDNKRRPAVALLLRDPDRKPQGAQEIIRKLFDLTPAETSLALLLTNGLTLEEAAEESGISKNTARTHLRAIFSKTGVTRQATLVRILLGSVVPLG